MNVDSVSLIGVQNKNKYLDKLKIPLNTKSKVNKNIALTVPRRCNSTSRISSQPLKDNTSNKASIALPILSKLNRRGLALQKRVKNKELA